MIDKHVQQTRRYHARFDMTETNLLFGPLSRKLNPLNAKFFAGNKHIHIHFMSLLHFDMSQVTKILPQVRPGPTYST